MRFFEKTEIYSVGEFMEIQRTGRTKEELKLVSMMVEHIKSNKVMYARVIFMIALLMNVNAGAFAYTGNFEPSLNEFGQTIVDLFLVAARWASVGMGFKSMITTLLSGGSMKNAVNEGVQYLLAFLFFQLYPQIFDLLRGIKF